VLSRDLFFRSLDSAEKQIAFWRPMTVMLSWCFAYKDCPQVALTSRCRMRYRILC